MKYINQLDYPYWLYVTRTDMDEANRIKGQTTTVATSGCGLCSAVMVADRLLVKSDFELKDALQLSYDVKANYKGGTNSERYFPAYAEKMGFHYKKTKDTEELRHCLRTGGAAIILVTGDRKDDGYHGVFSDYARHYIAAIAEERDGRILVLDPAYEEGGYEKGDRKGKVEVKGRGMGICEMKILEEETVPIETPFHLFWRG
ncbi:MAG: hypothetical protein E7445_02855 [Ruminococcaceae bacterium]|nr:hypothetical protein [Oscillospiraceae bacterium]